MSNKSDKAIEPRNPEPNDRRTPQKRIDLYRKSYQVGIAPNGRVSLHNGDDIAILLEYKPLELLKAMVAEFSTFDPDKYDHLNKGMVRMNLGNIIRKKVKDGLVSFGSVEDFATKFMETFVQEDV